MLLEARLKHRLNDFAAAIELLEKAQKVLTAEHDHSAHMAPYDYARRNEDSTIF